MLSLWQYEKQENVVCRAPLPFPRGRVLSAVVPNPSGLMQQGLQLPLSLGLESRGLDTPACVAMLTFVSCFPGPAICAEQEEEPFAVPECVDLRGGGAAVRPELRGGQIRVSVVSCCLFLLLPSL